MELIPRTSLHPNGPTWTGHDGSDEPGAPATGRVIDASLALRARQGVGAPRSSGCPDSRPGTPTSGMPPRPVGLSACRAPRRHARTQTVHDDDVVVNLPDGLPAGRRVAELMDRHNQLAGWPRSLDLGESNRHRHRASFVALTSRRFNRPHSIPPPLKRWATLDASTGEQDHPCHPPAP